MDIRLANGRGHRVFGRPVPDLVGVLSWPTRAKREAGRIAGAVFPPRDFVKDGAGCRES
jgi:hypothetical protein